MGQLAKGCTLQDMVSFEDADKDGRLIINEFYTAFSKLYSKFLPVSCYTLNLKWIVSVKSCCNV